MERGSKPGTLAQKSTFHIGDPLDIDKRSSSSYVDVVLQRQVAWFFVLTGVVNLGVEQHASKVFEGSKFTFMSRLCGGIWFYLLRLCCLCTLLWACFRLTYVTNHSEGFATIGQHFSNFCVVAQSLSMIPMARLLQRKLYHNLLASEESRLLRENIYPAIFFLIVALCLSLPYGVFKLINNSFETFPDNQVYYLLLFGEFGTCVLLAPVLLFQSVSISTTLVLVDQVYNRALIGNLSVEEYMVIEKTIRTRLKNDFWPEFWFFLINCMNTISFVLYWWAQAGTSLISQLLFSAMFCKEIVVTLVITFGAAQVNDKVDRTIVVLTEQLLAKLTNFSHRISMCHKNPRVIENPTHVDNLSFSGVLDGVNGAYSLEKGIDESMEIVGLCVANANRPISYRIMGIRLTGKMIIVAVGSFSLSLLILIVKAFLGV